MLFDSNKWYWRKGKTMQTVKRRVIRMEKGINRWNGEDFQDSETTSYDTIYTLNGRNTFIVFIC